ncbi:MAG: cyclopropane fatty acyl phospholipid synthase [Minisyncoccia bacterium]
MAERTVKGFLTKAGITVNGNHAWDIVVYDDRFYSRVLSQGSLGLGESYMDGWWDCFRIDQFIERVMKRRAPWFSVLNPITVSAFLQSRLTNQAPKDKAFVIGEKHYDHGNDLFKEMLGPDLIYSCAYWKGLAFKTDNLNAAQLAKLDLICRKLNLQPGQRVLDVGCGWGGFDRYAAKEYGVEVVGLTVSKEQADFARARCKGLPVEIRLEDYRDFRDGKKFDHVVSVGMFEHVGPKNYGIFMNMIKRNLKPGGLFLLHTIGSSARFFHYGDPWIKKYIFPVGELPTRGQIKRSLGGLEVRDWHEFGEYYDQTLMAWASRFLLAWPEKLEVRYGNKFDGKFFRMWKYYLFSCAGAFRAREIELWQVVLAHPDEHQNYNAVR